MITLEQYVGTYAASPSWTAEYKDNAARLLAACQLLSGLAEDDGVVFRINPKTKTQVGGITNGGFRPAECPVGARRSNHKTGHAVDWYDPSEAIDDWCMSNLDKLKACGIWIESPKHTHGWSHWQNLPPGSGNRVFIP